MDQNRLTFDPEYHAYWWDGNTYVPSVTQIGDANGHTSDFCKSKSHADRGTEIHEMIELAVRSTIKKRISIPDSAKLLGLMNNHPAEYNQFKDFCSDFGMKWTKAEEMVHGSLQYFSDNGLEYKPDWAGTKDLEGIDKYGRIHIIDVKTGKNPPPFTNLQTAAYTISSYPIGYEDINRMALKLHHTRKKYGTKSYTDRSDFSIWAQEVKRYKRNNTP